MGVLILLRHGQSQWNLENRFTGWIDIDLAPKGIEEANSAAEKISSLSMRWDEAHTSRLIRAQHTLDIILEKLKLKNIPIWIDSALNERFYGDLQGMNKDDARAKWGKEQVQIWRRSFDVPPPGGECLADTSKRTLPYFREYILKKVVGGKNILVSAHGNSLRSIIMYLEKMTPEEILKFEIETGVPYRYDIDESGKVGERKVLLLAQ